MIDIETVHSLVSEWFAECATHVDITRLYHMIVSECEEQMMFMHGETEAVGALCGGRS